MKFMYLRCRTSGSPTRRALALALAVSLAGLPMGGTVVLAQQPIQIFLSAVDNDGKPVTDLKAEEVERSRWTAPNARRPDSKPSTGRRS